ncbi:MAG TPA: 2'-5' RNA ligase family protein, partial [Gemmatimonadaceae bacterium]
MSAPPERLFIGVPLTEEARQAIARSLPKNLPGAPVAPESWHFTLRFLGSTLAGPRDTIVERLEAARCGAPFVIRFSELGAFPRASRARILWLGIDEGVERMIQLAAIAEASARIAGLAA